MAAKPLDGIRVADFSWFGAGPIAAQTLATFGAEVVRIESEAKLDSLRVVQPFALEEDGSFKSSYNVSGYFNNVNAGNGQRSNHIAVSRNVPIVATRCHSRLVNNATRPAGAGAYNV